MSSPPDPRLLRAITALDEERKLRLAAQKEAVALRSVLKRLERQRTSDAAPTKPERRAER